MNTIHTVRVEQLPNLPVIKMTWDHKIANGDALLAFDTINNWLNESDSPLYVMVDILSNPNFPMAETLRGAAFGPYRNPKLKEWLIVGSNPTAKMIENVLASVTGRRNVFWFDTEDEALNYLEIKREV